MAEWGFSHPLCLDIFLPFIPITVAMIADTEHVGERQPHPLTVMELECQIETCPNCSLFSGGLKKPQKCLVTGINIIIGKHKQKTATGQKYGHQYVSRNIIPAILTPYCLSVHFAWSSVYLLENQARNGLSRINHSSICASRSWAT